MQTFTFLSALPALLGLAGFVLYQVLGANKAGDDISKRIVEKLRTEKNSDIPIDRRLTPKQVGRVLDQQQHLRTVVGEYDFHLLKQALTQQFIVTIVVYVLTFGFCSWSVYLFAQSPQKNGGTALTGAPTSLGQTSNGNNSPNIVSNGSGAVNVTIQDQTKPASGSRTEDKKK